MHTSMHSIITPPLVPLFILGSESVSSTNPSITSDIQSQYVPELDSSDDDTQNTGSFGEKITRKQREIYGKKINT